MTLSGEVAPTPEGHEPDRYQAALKGFAQRSAPSFARHIVRRFAIKEDPDPNSRSVYGLHFDEGAFESLDEFDAFHATFGACFVFTPEAFVERLAALIPPPRANTVLDHGILASRARDRDRLLPRPTPRRQRARSRLTKAPTTSVNPRWTPWAELLRRVFDEHAPACPHCGEAMTLRTMVVRPRATLKVLSSLRASARGPP
ncbi:MAG: hypothetical protein AB8H79_10345 [Myxococcota bacterium]